MTDTKWVVQAPLIFHSNALKCINLEDLFGLGVYVLKFSLQYKQNKRYESPDICASKIARLEITGLGRFEDRSRRKNDSRPAGANGEAPPSMIHETRVKKQRSEFFWQIQMLENDAISESSEDSSSKIDPPRSDINDSQLHENTPPPSKPPAFIIPSMPPPPPKNSSKTSDMSQASASTVKDAGYTRPEWSGPPLKQDFPYFFEVLKL